MRRIIYIFGLMLLFVSCGNDPFPRPYGYYRIDLPEHHYVQSPVGLPYQFALSAIAQVAPAEKPGWIDIVYPSLNARVHCSYKQIDRTSFQVVTEESRELAYKHAIKASGIYEQYYENPKQKVYGILYDIEGDVASPIQFYMTDSTRNFLRGSLYFNSIPNQDSLAPIVTYLREDIIRIVEQLKWAN